MTKRLAARRRHAADRLREVTTMPPLDAISDDVLLTRSQVATLANVSVKTIANREGTNRPIFPVTRIGGIPRYRAGTVKAYLRGEVDSTTASAST